MRFLLIGGTGFLGHQLDTLLSAAGHEVAVCDNFLGSTKYRIKTDAHLFVADATQYNTLKPVFVKFLPEVVIICLAHHFNSGSTYNFFDDSKAILNNANTVSWLLSEGVKHVYFCSTNEVYGGPDAKKPIKETRKILRSTTHHGAAKLAAEKLIAFRCQELKIPFTVLRIFDLYGPRITFNARNDIVNFIIDATLRGEQLGVQQAGNARDFIHVDDATSAIVGVIDSEYCGVVNIGVGQGTNLRSICKNLKECMDVRHEPVFLPSGRNPTFSNTADTTLLRTLLPESWEPKNNILSSLPELVQFRKDEIAFDRDSAAKLAMMQGR